MNVRFSFVISLAALLGACATSSVQISPVARGSNMLTDNAQTLLAQGYYEQAAARYQMALDKNPEDGESRHGLAQALRLGGRLDAAAEEYGKLAATSEWKMRGAEGLARIDLAKGDRAGALERFSAVVEADAWAWKSWLAIAQLSDLSHDWTKADQAYGMALAASDAPAVVHNNHGVSLLARGHAAGAADLFRKAMAADPTLTIAKTNADLADAAAGRKATFEAAGGDARERARTLNNFGYVAMLMDRPAEAKSYYEAAMKEHPSFYALAYTNLAVAQRSRR